MDYYFIFKQETTVYQVTVDHLNNIVGEAMVNKLLLNYIQTEMKKKELIIRDYTFYGKKGAIYSNLMRLVHSFGKVHTNGKIVIDITLTHEEISQLCGMSRERITKTIVKLKDSKILTYDKKSKHIIILDLDFIKRQIHCESCPLLVCNIS